MSQELITTTFDFHIGSHLMNVDFGRPLYCRVTFEAINGTDCPVVTHIAFTGLSMVRIADYTQLADEIIQCVKEKCRKQTEPEQPEETLVDILDLVGVKRRENGYEE